LKNIDSIVKDKEGLMLCFLYDCGIIQFNLPQQVRAGISWQFFIVGLVVQRNGEAPAEQGVGINRTNSEILLHTFP